MKVYKKINPSNGEFLYEVEIFDRDKVRKEVDAAREGLSVWGNLSLSERVKILKNILKKIKERKDEFVKVVMEDAGKVKQDAIVEIFTTVNHIHYLTKKGYKYLKPEKRSSGYFKNYKCFVQFKPWGVVGIISPWNYPLILTATPLFHALLAGNTVVLKPSEITTKVSLLLEEVCKEAGLPDNVFRVVTGDGSTGRELVESNVDMVCFTGSTAVGIEIAKKCSERLIPYVLELGGKDNAIVFEDADLGRAAAGIVWGGISNGGQTCIGVENVLVEESIYDKFIEMLKNEVEKIPKEDLGAVINSIQFEKIEYHIEDALKKRAELVCGGKRLDDYHFEPTVLKDITPDMKVFYEETFGPILGVMKFNSEEELIKIANSLEYGLNGSIWTKDRNKAERIAKKLDTGTMCINDCLTNYLITDLPFGGVKKSGIGRVHGVEGVRAFAKMQSITVRKFGLKKELWWYPYSKKIINLFLKAIKILY
ncbi:succinate-semialdehyde dehydrogenase (NADP+) [Thermotomaculum hydrothermale]|uniref:Aldehyde dehydrogenase n=1 Tax=Thermotomaculum hydrothermale TaxID=981385 RepID=A0A7R6SXR2_9BACT|nr:aldehyde dehydrogenase family protein [Thermotomaculum hydrothermale]BBB31825.1 succinate-semialdehyde dehydrogenase (NADP+) [Thermotomaculum hydrothermale]